MCNKCLPEHNTSTECGKQYMDPIPVSPSLTLPMSVIKHDHLKTNLDRKAVVLCLLSILVGILAGLIAKVFTALIGLITNLTYYGKFSARFSSPAGNHLGYFAIIVPIVGGLVVGVMARYGSAGIRGHGIPEAMEQILSNESRIPPRLIILKPLSAAVSIGTGGPFGAEGPIISTGGALGSFVGQILHTTASERKTLLAAGAAAGMAATFGAPVSAVFLAIELLLFELKPASLSAVVLACASAEVVRMVLTSSAPMFPMGHVAPANLTALMVYSCVGVAAGLLSVLITKLVYAIEDGFDKLPIHWAWWPALGGLAVGITGLISPNTLGVGYYNIDALVSGKLIGIGALLLCMFKLISWSVALGSGTSGGTLAPLFTIGGGVGSVLGLTAANLFPHAGVDVRVAALVGMASMFAGASRAVLTSILFAFEVTHQQQCLLPLLIGCMLAYIVSSLFMRETIMTEKIARRGVTVPTQYSADYFDHMKVSDVVNKSLVVLQAEMSISEAKMWIKEQPAQMLHHQYPVKKKGELLGIVSLKDIFCAPLDGVHIGEIAQNNRSAITENAPLSQAADAMVELNAGCIPVVSADNPNELIGIITRADLLLAHERKMHENQKVMRHIHLKMR